MPVNNLITVRKGSASSWTSSGAILASGEPGFDTTNKIFKVGDGVSNWSSLFNQGVFSDLDVISTVNGATLFNVEGTNGSLFSVVDNLSGTLMSVNNNAGLPVFEVFSDDRIVGGRFGFNDFVLTSGGNLGVGTSSPRGRLDVTGGLKVGGYSDIVPGSGSELVISNANSVVGAPNTNTAGIVLQHNGFNTVYIRSNPTNLRIGNNAGDALVMTHSNRRIGIGTSSPNEQVEVSGHIRLSDTAGGVTQGNVIQFSRGGGGRFDYTIGRYGDHLALSTASDGSTQRHIQFGFHDGSNVFQPKTTINGFNGNVGIGTVSPTGALHVNGTAIITGEITATIDGGGVV